MLLGLDMLECEGLIGYDFRNELQSVYHGRAIPIERKFGHLYVTWNSKHIIFTRLELLSYTDISGIRNRKNFMPLYIG